MRSIVTGGAGFIGSNLTRRLIQAGHEVSVFDNFATGHKHNLRDVSNHIRMFTSFTSLESVKKPDVIFHLGIPSSSPMYKQNPFLVSEALNDWFMILEYAKRNDCRIVYASSSSVYNGNTPPFTEDMPILVTDYYTECRYGMERLAELYFRLHNVPSIGLRLFSVYGPNEKFKGQYANCLTQFLWAMRQGESPLIFGDGSQTRDLIYVSDVVDAFYSAAIADISYGIFNVGTGIAYSFNDIVDLLNQALGTHIQPTKIENPIKNYVMTTLADTTHTENVLGFKAQIPLKDGIDKLKQAYLDTRK